MSTVVGQVSKLEGVIRAINPATGDVRIIEEGSQVFAGEIIQTSGKGGVVVDMNNGSLLTLGRDTQMRLDDDVSGQASTVDASTEGAVDVEALQQAVLEGNFDALEETAAGEALLIGSASDGGVTVERIALTGEVTAGFDTTADSQTFEDIARDAEAQAEVIVAPDVTISIVATDASGNILANSTVAEGAKAYYKLVAKDPAGNIIDGAVGTADVAFTDPVAAAYETVKLGDDKVVTTITDEGDGNYGSEDTVYAVIDGPAPTSEGDITGNFTIRLLDENGNPVVVKEATDVEVVFTNGTAEVGDYNATTQTVTIGINSSSAPFTVQTNVDADHDNETFNAKISSVDDNGQFEKVDIDGFTDTAGTVHVGNVDATIFDKPDVSVPDRNGDVEGTESVYEAGLLTTDGSGKDEFVNSSFTVSAGAGVDDVLVMDKYGDEVQIVSNNALVGGLGLIETTNGQMTITGYDANTGVVSYTYRVVESQTHTKSTNDNSIIDGITVGVTDSQGLVASGTVEINIVDDAPVVNSDITITADNDGTINVAGDMPVYVPADDTTLAWDLASSTIPSPLYVDGKEVAVSVSGDQVIGTVDDGTTTVFTLDPTLADANGSTYSFDMNGTSALGIVSQATGFDVISGGNTDTAEFNFTDSSGKIFATATVTSSDDDLSDTDSVNTRDKYIGVDNNWIDGGNGNVLSFDYGSDQVKSANFSLNGLNSGETAKWTAEGFDKDGNSVTLTGTVDGTGTGAASSSDEYFTINAPVDGYISKLTFEAEGSSDYRLGFEGLHVFDYNTNVDMSFNYTLTDADSDTDSGKIDINLEGKGYSISSGNEVPTSIDELQSMTFESQTMNLLFTLDVSGSMSANSRYGSVINGKTRFEIAQESIINTINSYKGQASDVMVNMTLFNSGAKNLGWMTADKAIAELNKYTLPDDMVIRYEGDKINGLKQYSTDYKDALNETATIDFANYKANSTVAYFLSDGNPTQNANAVNEDSDTTIQNWKSFVDTNVTTLNVIGIGSDVSESYLKIVQTQSDDVTVVADESQLSNVLVSTVTATSTVSGNILDNVTGGDGTSTIDSINVNGQDYTSSTFPAAGLDLSGSGRLVVDFANGGYSYTANSSEFNVDVIKTFAVTASDTDGDKTTFNVDINVDMDTSDGASFIAGNEEEVLIIPDSIDSHVEGFDAYKDTLDISEVITDTDAEVAANTLAEYLDFSLVDSDGDGDVDDTAIKIDSNGESDAGGDVRTVFIQDQDLTTTPIDDLNIDYQND